MNLDKLTSKIIEYSFYALLVIVPLILTPYNYELFEFNKMLTVYFFTVIISISWLIKNIINSKLIFKRTPFDIPLILFFFSQLLSTVFSIDPHTSLWGYYSRFHGGLISTISYLILFYAYVTHMRNKTRNCLRVILSTALIVSLYAIAEHFGIDKHLWVQDVQNRVFSTLGQPNWLAAYLLTLLPLSIALLLKTKNQKLALYYSFLTIIYYLAFLYTKSRSGLAGLALAYAVFWGLLLLKRGFKKFPFKKFLLVSGFFCLITLSVGTGYTPSIKSFIKTQPSTQSAEVPSSQSQTEPPAITLGGSRSADIREVVWQGALDIWKKYPVFGSGVETFAYSYYNHRPIEHNLLSEWDFLYNKAHNEFFNFLSTTGAFGLSTYLLIIIWFTSWTFKHFKKDKTHLTSAFLAGFLGLGVSNFFGFSVVPVALFFFLWPALALDLTGPKPDTQPPQPPHYILQNSHYTLITLALFLGLYLNLKIITAWRADYHFSLGKDYIKIEQIPTGYQNLAKAVSLSPREPLFRSEFSEVSAKLAVVYHSQLNQPPEDLPPDQMQSFQSQLTGLRDQMINQAIQDSNLVISQNPVHLNYWKSRIKIFLLLTMIDQRYQNQALETFQKAIDLAPTDPKLKYNLSLLYNQMGQTGLAEQVLKDSIDLKVNYEAARFNLASLYEQTNRPDLAKEQYQYIFDYLNPDNQKVGEKLEQLQN